MVENGGKEYLECGQTWKRFNLVFSSELVSRIDGRIRRQHVSLRSC